MKVKSIVLITYDTIFANLVAQTFGLAAKVQCFNQFPLLFQDVDFVVFDTHAESDLEVLVSLCKRQWPDCRTIFLGKENTPEAALKAWGCNVDIYLAKAPGFNVRLLATIFGSELKEQDPPEPI